MLRPVHTLRRLAIVTPLLLLIATGAVAWYTSGELYEGALQPPPPRHPPRYEDALVTQVDDSTVTLRSGRNRSPRLARGGTWGLQWSNGYGRVGRILEERATGVRREFVIERGTLAPGTHVGLDAWAYSGTPFTSLHLPYEEVTVSAPLGAFPAWFVAGSKTTWIIFVHGKGGGREEALRAMDVFAPMGFPCLAVTYRNDPGVPSSEDRRYHYGVTEWEDLDAAVDYAIRHGASDLVLVGYSMGGGVVINFMERSSHVSRVRGLVLEAPCVQLTEVLDYGLGGFRLPVLSAPLPPLLRSASKRLAEIRYGVHWSSFDRPRDAPAISVPVLLLHGEKDLVIPITTSDELARSGPQRVQFARFPEAGHVECWNVDRDRYRSLVQQFIASASTTHAG